MVTQAADLESSVSVVAFEATGAVTLCVSMTRDLPSSVLSPVSDVFNLSLMSHGVELSTSPVYHMVATSFEPCSILINQLLRVITGLVSPSLLAPLLLTKSPKPSSAFYNRLRLIYVVAPSSKIVKDISIVWFDERIISKLVSVQYTTNQRLEDWSLFVKISVVICLGNGQFSPICYCRTWFRFSGRLVLYLPPYTIVTPQHITYAFTEILLQSLRFSTCSSTVPLGLHHRSRQQESRQYKDFIICKNDAAWNKDGKKSGYGWIILGGNLVSPVHGMIGQSFINSLLIAEAVVMR